MSVIGIDLDDVLADFMTVYMDAARKRYNRPPAGSMPIDWEWSNVLPSKEEQAKVWEDVQSKHNFWLTLPVEDGASREMLQALDAKHSVYFPTARVESVGMSARKQSAAWLTMKFGIAYPAVIVAYEKAPMALALKYDYFIDDRPKNCIDIQKALPNCKVYLKDASHNQTFDAEANGFTRVKSFDEFAAIVLQEAK